LKLQVAIKVSQDDSVLISSLKTQAHESKTKEIAAERMALEAAEMITSLTYEINALKRKFKITDDKSNQSQANRNIYKVADTEVDEMMTSPSRSKSSRVTRRVECVAVPESATPFDAWKMSQYIFSPDTPAASLNHDKSVVEMLLATTTSELHVNDIDRPTINSISKRRQRHGGSFSPQQKSPEEPAYAKGTNIYETVTEDFLDAPYMPFSMLTIGSERLVPSPDSIKPAPIMWGGDGGRPDRDNLGRLNIWTSVADSSEPFSSNAPKSIRRVANENNVRFDVDSSSKPRKSSVSLII